MISAPPSSGSLCHTELALLKRIVSDRIVLTIYSESALILIDSFLSLLKSLIDMLLEERVENGLVLFFVHIFDECLIPKSLLRLVCTLKLVLPLDDRVKFFLRVELNLPLL